jgi:hypothetical protein
MCVCVRAYELAGGGVGVGDSQFTMSCTTTAKSRECTISVIAAMSRPLRHYVLQCSMTMGRAHCARNKVIIFLLDAMQDP